MKPAIKLILSILIISASAGCASNSSSELPQNQSTRLWVPADGIVNWAPLFPTENVSFTVSYVINSSGKVEQLDISNIEPYQEYDAAQLELISQIRFVPTVENQEMKPVQITSRIELDSL